MATMQVDLVSVERAIWSGEATGVFARTREGELGVLPGHTPLLGALEPGWVVRIERESEDDLRVAVHGGFLSVRKDGVSVLAEMAETADEIDVTRARAAFDKADPASGPEGEAARNRALSRLRAAGESV
jgi:F-type H+-transporting ATPase subunit epsilon